MEPVKRMRFSRWIAAVAVAAAMATAWSGVAEAAAVQWGDIVTTPKEKIGVPYPVEADKEVEISATLDLTEAKKVNPGLSAGYGENVKLTCEPMEGATYWDGSKGKVINRGMIGAIRGDGTKMASTHTLVIPRGAINEIGYWRIPVRVWVTYDINDAKPAQRSAPRMADTLWVELVVFTAELEELSFTSAHHVLVKSGDKDTYASDGGAEYGLKDWVHKTGGNPIIHTLGQKVEADVKVTVKPVGVKFKLVGEGKVLAFAGEEKSIGKSQDVHCVTDEALPAEVKIHETVVIPWVVTAYGSPQKALEKTETPAIYAVFGKPVGKATKKRMKWVCGTGEKGQAGGKATPEAAADEIGPDAMTRFLGQNSMFGEPEKLSWIDPKTKKENKGIKLANEWQVLDGTKADCRTICTLMKSELNLLGELRPVVCLVFGRHKDWTGYLPADPVPDVKQPQPFGPEGQKIPIVLDNQRRIADCRLAYLATLGDPKTFNYYEATCYFLGTDGNWWMGGLAKSKKSAARVIIEAVGAGEQVWYTEFAGETHIIRSPNAPTNFPILPIFMP